MIAIIGIIIVIVLIQISFKSHKEVQGFYSINANQSDWKNLRFDLLSTIALYFINPTEQGDIDIKDSDIPKDLIKLAHENNIKVVISIQPKESSTIDALLTTSKDDFLNNIVDFIKRNDLDGVDIDIENINGTNSIVELKNKQLMTDFMKDLSIKLWNVNPNYRISIDINGNYHHVEKVFDLNVIQGYVNYILIMGYDYHWLSGPIAGSVAPVDSYNNDISIRDSLNYYSGIIDKNKLLLGVPYYGLEWSTIDGDVESPTTARGKYYNYKEMKDRADKYGRIWDNTWKTPWYKYQEGDKWYQGHYDDLQSLGIKYDLVNSINIAGIGIWEVGYGDKEPELWQLMQEKFGKR